MARDERRFDLGNVVGAQVKAGPSYFDEPKRDRDGNLVGWWFRDDDRQHIDTWLAHSLPHLVVLYDLDARIAYWVHVTADNLVPTGIGAKILVPVANMVDREHRQALLDVAASQRPRIELEGTAWGGIGSIEPSDRLRYAMIVPRLVAPHPNAGHDYELTPEEAVALLVQARLRDPDALPTGPRNGSAPSSWTWTFVDAMRQRVTGKGIEALLATVNDAPDPARRAAATVAAASILIDDEEADRAASLLEATLARDDADPVDHAWLQVQHARACAEIGRLEQARAEAINVQAVRARAPTDVTASAIAGAAGILLFNTASWGERDLADVVAGADTAAGWWQTQTTSRALFELAHRSFRDWAQDPSVTIWAEDVINNQLVAASLLASHAGEQADWRSIMALLGRDQLIRLDRHASPEDAAAGITTLRLAGHEQPLKIAVRRLAANGPARALTLAAAQVQLPRTTRTTAPTSLALLEHAGDLLDEDTANRALLWLMDTLSDASRFVKRTTPSYLLLPRLVETLAAVIPAASAVAHRAVVDLLVGLPAQEGQVVATAWARVIDALPERTWSENIGGQLAKTAEEHHPVLRSRLTAIIAKYDRQARAALERDAAEGSTAALAALGDAPDLPSELVAPVAARLGTQLDRIRAEARCQGSQSYGGEDPAHALAVLNAWHPANAKWEPLVQFLGDSAVWSATKRGALDALGTLTEQLPPDVANELKPIANMLTDPQAQGMDSPFEDAVGAASFLASRLDPTDEATAARVSDLLGGDSHMRPWAAKIVAHLDRPERSGILVALANDVDPDVRAAAAAGLAHVASVQPGDQLAEQGLRRALLDPGTRVPATIAHVLASKAQLNGLAAEALAECREHPSARVRSTATAALTTHRSDSRCASETDAT